MRRDVKLKMAARLRDGEEGRRRDQGREAQEGAGAIQGEQVRVSGPSRDDLQEAIALLRSKDFGVELKFGNYR